MIEGQSFQTSTVSVYEKHIHFDLKEYMWKALHWNKNITLKKCKIETLH